MSSESINPGFLLDGNKINELENYLHRQRWMDQGENIILTAKPGEGNMNYVLRIKTGSRSFILKQSRAYVEKYPHIPAPANRALIEGEYYMLVGNHPELRAYGPALLNVDEENNIIMMEDLGEASDYTYIYKKGKQLNMAEVEEISRYISLLHNNFNTSLTEDSIVNRGMRELNAEYIFNYPFLEDNGFDLDTVTPGMQGFAMRFKKDAALRKNVRNLEKYYLDDGDYLLHGDHYPGSWLKTPTGLKVIDPEFTFFGPAEFDVSVMMAHYIMSEQPEELREAAMGFYCSPPDFDDNLRKNLTGVEVMRRLIGLAQLPLELSLDEKEIMLDAARAMIMD